MTRQINIGFAILITLIWSSIAAAITVNERVPDAGELPPVRGDIPAENLAQVVSDETDDGVLEIIAILTPADDVDMYRILISHPATFSATTDLSGINISVENTQLFLFDANGNGVCANDDKPNALSDDINAARAVLPQGGLSACNLQVGLYYLAISTFPRYPVSSDDERLFPPEPRNIVAAPDLPGVPIVDWEGGGRGGSYMIRLTGVNFPPPECGESVPLTTTTEGFERGRDILLTVTDTRGIQTIEVLELDNIRYIEIPENTEPPFSSHEEENLESTRTFNVAPNTVTMKAFSAEKYDHASGKVRVVNTLGAASVCQLNATQVPDTIPPQCCFRVEVEGENPVFHVEVIDNETGITGIHFDFLRNINMTIPAAEFPEDGDPPPVKTDVDDFDKGKTAFFVDRPIRRETITLRVTRAIPPIDRSRPNESTAVVRLLDNNLECTGNTPDTCRPAPNISGNCDPHIFDMIIDAERFVKRVELNNLTENDHHVVIRNKEPGLTLMALRANEGRLHAHRLHDNEVKQVNTEADMVEGTNRIRFTGIGRPLSEATVMIFDHPVTLETPAVSSDSDALFQPRRTIQECTDD